MATRQTRSCGSPNKATANTKKSNQTITTITEAAYKKLQEEKNVAARQLEILKGNYGVALEETENLEKSILNVKGEIETKDSYLQKYKTKCAKIKDKIVDLKRDIDEFDNKAVTANAKIESLNKARKILEGQRDAIFTELENHKQAFFLSTLKHGSGALQNNHNEYHHSGLYNEGRSLEDTTNRPYQSSRRYRRSPVEHRHRR